MTLDLPVAGVTTFRRYDPGHHDIAETAVVAAVKIQYHEGKVHHWTATVIGASGIAKIDSHSRPVNRNDWHPSHWSFDEKTNKLIPAPAPSAVDEKPAEAVTEAEVEGEPVAEPIKAVGRTAKGR